MLLWEHHTAQQPPQFTQLCCTAFFLTAPLVSGCLCRLGARALKDGQHDCPGPTSHHHTTTATYNTLPLTRPILPSFAVVQVGTRALKDNMTALGPKVLPLSEKLAFAGNMVTRQLARWVTCVRW
jgi:hypothetical protein